MKTKTKMKMKMKMKTKMKMRMKSEQPLRQPVDVTLQRGQRHEMDPQPPFVFSIEDTSLAGFARAVDALAKAVLKPASQ